MLNHRNATVDPVITAQNAESMSSPFAYAITPNTPNARMSNPLAKPSRPSVRLTEFDVARMMNMNRGMYHHPKVTSPMPGTFIESNPNFAKNHQAPTPPKMESHSSLNFALSPFCLPIPLMLR